jgi:glycosyltransferase involved in cell wall biosynthesis
MSGLHGEVETQEIRNGKLGVFMPAYEAAKTLNEVLERFTPDLWNRVAHVFIIDDGSHDATSQVAETWGVRQPKVAVIRFAVNRGYGAAVTEGLRQCREAGCHVAACLHADGQYPPECILQAVALLSDKGWDIVQGSRHLPGTARQGGMPQYKIWAGRALVALENACFKIKMTDYHSGFLVYGNRALRGLPFEKLSGYFDFDLEVLATACAKGLKVGEMGIPTRYADEVSHLHPLKYGLRVLGVLARYQRGHYARL